MKKLIIFVVVVAVVFWWWSQQSGSANLTSSEATNKVSKASPTTAPAFEPRPIPTSNPTVINQDTNLVEEINKLKLPELNTKNLESSIEKF